MATVSPVEQAETDLEVRHVTIDQIVAMNMRYWRRAAGMTQEDLGFRLGWSAANVSAAERSAEEGRDRRRFDADTLTALSLVIGVPLHAFFFPPGDDGDGKRYVFTPPPEYDEGEFGMRDLARARRDAGLRQQQRRDAGLPVPLRGGGGPVPG